MHAVRREGSKVYIEDVPRMSWDTGEMCEFSSALVRCMECLGEPLAYHHAMGTSGVAFRFVLSPDIWEPGNYSIRYFTEEPNEPVLRACLAAGREATVCERGRYADDRSNIVASINNGIPVMAFGVVGPSDCALVTGYDSDGDVLLGWSTYQDVRADHDVPHDPLGYFRKPEWHEKTHGYVLLGGRHEPTSRASTYRDALQLARRVVRTPTLGDRSCGLRALEVWAQAMGDDANFDVDEATREWRYLGLSVNTTMLIDQLSAVPFLEEAASALPEVADELAPAIDAYRAIAHLTGQARSLIADDFSREAKKRFADAAIRKDYAEVMRGIQEHTGSAVCAMEDALDHLRAGDR